MTEDRKTEIFRIIVLSLLYALIANARSIQPNPFIPGAVIAVYMVVPVIGGILFGPLVGLTVGVFGTLLTAVSPASSPFEFASVLPHGLMGLTAGFLRGRMPTPFVAAIALAVGHGLNLTSYVISNLLELTSLEDPQFWYGLGYEELLGIVTVFVMVTFYRLGFPTKNA
jgi:LytS/YehU family sensor histidine kinase